ncbi:MAG: hypothetical protein WBE91_05135 [Steroidobacteraceae bacterium]
MATAKHTRRPAGSSQSKSRAKARNPVPASVQKALGEELGREFLSARAAAYSAVLALETKGVYTHIAMSLRMHVLNPLARIEAAVTGREVQP